MDGCDRSKTVESSEPTCANGSGVRSDEVSSNCASLGVVMQQEKNDSATVSEFNNHDWESLFDVSMDHSLVVSMSSETSSFNFDDFINKSNY